MTTDTVEISEEAKAALEKLTAPLVRTGQGDYVRDIYLILPEQRFNVLAFIYGAGTMALAIGGLLLCLWMGR